jgi:CHRD domain
MKNRLLIVPLAAVLTVVLVASGALAMKPLAFSATKFTAALNIGQEKPHPKGTKAGASGRFTATLNGTALTWRLTFKQLSGPATAAHIHTGARGTSGAVLVPLCGPCSSPASGSATLTSTQINSLNAGKLYVNVHTSKNPNGEIRGQISGGH